MKKSWFFFDDTIVFLTNSITSPSSNRVETVIQQWPLSATSTITRQGDWTFCDGAGYYVYPQSAPLHVERITRTGTWAALGGSTDTMPHTATFLTMWLDHGVAPAGATAAYAISLNGTTVPAIVANDAKASVVRSGDMTGIVFWAAGSAAGYSSSIPAVLYVKGGDLYVADPTNGAGTFTITVPGGARYTLSRNGGATSHVIVPAANPRKRVVR